MKPIPASADYWVKKRQRISPDVFPPVPTVFGRWRGYFMNI
jgi:hypothetical protein